MRLGALAADLLRQEGKMPQRLPGTGEDEMASFLEGALGGGSLSGPEAGWVMILL
jgi:hypothetical protein